MTSLQNKNKSTNFPSLGEAIVITFLLLSLEYILANVFPEIFNNFFGNAFITLVAFLILIYIFLKKKIYMPEVLINKKYNDWIIPSSIYIIISSLLFINVVKEIEIYLKHDIAYLINYFNNEGLPIDFFLTTVIVAPITEEIFFRGIILNSFVRNYGEIKAIILSSLIFSICHFERSEIMFTKLIGAFLFGMILSILFVKTKNINLVIGLHILTNFLSVFFQFIISIVGVKIAGIKDLAIYMLILFCISSILFCIGYMNFKKVKMIEK